jgi:RNA polymerase sigma-70 factor (ECF subfamily)
MLKVSSPDMIARAQKGDSGVITALYEQNRLGVFRFLYYRVGDTQTAEDLTSEVFLRMITALESYRPQNTSFEAWLYQIARNLSIDYYRKASIRNHLPLEENLTVETQDVDKTVERSLTHEHLKRALAKLNEVQRDVIVLRFVNGLPISVVAQTLHKSEDSIKSLQRRALSELRAILNEWEVHYV